MTPARRLFLLSLMFTMLLAMAAASRHAAAQAFPARPVRLIVADAAGGAPDQLARIVAQKMSEGLGQQVIVDNKPGAGGALGAEMAARAPADGHTLLMTTTAIYAILPNLKKNLPFDPVRDFASLSRIATASNVLVVNQALPAASVGELVQLARSRPGVLNYASAGIGTPAHLAGEMLNQLAGVKLTHIPYKGAAPALLDVIAGNAQLIITSPIAAAAHLGEGRVRALATTGTERNPSLPQLPTVADAVPGYEITQSWGIVAPAGTPAPLLKVLTDEVVRVMSSPDVRERIAKTGAVPGTDAGSAFDAFMARERKRLGEVVARSGIVLAE
ncbi:MAG: tripartite tricarboxylate transporter substrate binding protein [Burkholderiales bacterium]|nr:tripartite tricarboxylate transporter substrate binding protein [Burkholderiales bacterium]